MSGSACAKAKMDLCVPPALMESFKGYTETFFYYVENPTVRVSKESVDQLTSACRPVVQALEAAIPKLKQIVEGVIAAQKD